MSSSWISFFIRICSGRGLQCTGRGSRSTSRQRRGAGARSPVPYPVAGLWRRHLGSTVTGAHVFGGGECRSSAEWCVAAWRSSMTEVGNGSPRLGRVWRSGGKGVDDGAEGGWGEQGRWRDMMRIGGYVRRVKKHLVTKIFVFFSYNLLQLRINQSHLQNNHYISGRY